MFLNRIQRKIDSAKVVSFDIFDTLLVRPYVRPADLFLHIEKLTGKYDFCSARIEAEITARQKATSDDITLDAIYNELDSEYECLKEEELELEALTLSQNPEMKQVWDYAVAQGKKIVITSDMYLPTGFLEGVLTKNGYRGYSSLYVSCDMGVSKATGRLYKHIISQLQVHPHEIVHIGDNKASDYKQACKAGITAILYEKRIDAYFRENKKARAFYEENEAKIGASILMGVLANNWCAESCSDQADNYWQNIGYEYAGPVAWGFSKFVESQARQQQLDTLLFIARDGYTLHKVYSTFNSGAKSFYIYAPRFINAICNLDYDSKDASQSGDIINYYAERNEEIKEAYNRLSEHNAFQHDQFIQSHRVLFDELARETRQQFKKYLTSRVQGATRIGLVDSVTIAFSAQKLVEKTLGQPVCGLYWGVEKNRYQNRFEHYTYIANDEEIKYNTRVFTKKWDFMEFLLSAPEYPIMSVSEDGTPSYSQNPGSEEIRRAAMYPCIADNAVRFAQDIARIFGGKDIFLEGRTIVRWVDALITSPSERDIHYMSEIQISMNKAHTIFQPLFAEKVTLAEAICSPKKTRKRIERNMWKSRSHRLMLCLLKPLHVKRRGLKRLSIGLFPYLERQYLHFSISFSEKCFYKFFIGRE